MGVPVVTLPGDSYVSRQSASLSWRIGDHRGIATDREDYVERAVALAREVATVREERSSLRERVHTRLCDRARHAAEFGALLERWCTSGASGDTR